MLFLFHSISNFCESKKGIRIVFKTLKMSSIILGKPHLLLVDFMKISTRIIN